MSLEFEPTRFADAWLIRPKVFADGRGYFLESFAAREFEQHGIAGPFVQDDHSRSVEQGVLRGLHFQLPPRAQAKLVRVTRGSVFDVIVDLRVGSPTFAQWQGFDLTADNFLQLYVPAGFGHGFCTTSPDTHVQYKVTEYYSPEHDSGILWSDPQLAIAWPIGEPVISAKDSALPLFRDFESPF